MATRIVEGKKPYTGGKAIEITKDKVINLKLRDENNLIIYDDGDNEIYVDLQLPNEIEPTDAFPVGVNTGRVIVDNGWDKTGTLISAKTTSGDNIQLLYADDGTLWIDNGTGTFKQILFKGDIDDIVATLTEYIDLHDTVVSDTAPSDPYEGMLWYDTTNDTLKVYNGSTWVSTGSGGGGDVLVSTQANNIFTPGMKIWGGTQSDYQSLTPDSNTAYLLLADQPTPPSPGWQPGANTIAYYNINDNDTNSTIYDLSGNGNDLSGTITYTTDAVAGKVFQSGRPTHSIIDFGNSYTFISWVYITGHEGMNAIFTNGASPSSYASNGISTYSNDAYLSGGWNVGDLSAGDPSIIGTTGLSINTWCMIAYSRDSSGDMKIYINGVVDNTATDYHNPVYPSGTNFMLGGWGGGGNNFQGMIKVLIGENKSRTAQEIADYYDATKGDYGIS